MTTDDIRATDKWTEKQTQAYSDRRKENYADIMISSRRLQEGLEMQCDQIVLRTEQQTTDRHTDDRQTDRQTDGKRRGWKDKGMGGRMEE